MPPVNEIGELHSGSNAVGSVSDRQVSEPQIQGGDDEHVEDGGRDEATEDDHRQRALDFATGLAGLQCQGE